jgi:hypothetical protein
MQALDLCNGGMIWSCCVPKDKVLSQVNTVSTLIKKKIRFSSYIRRCWMEQLQSHKWLTASSYMGKYLRISSYIRKPYLLFDFATAPLWISLYMRKILFSFLSVYRQYTPVTLRFFILEICQISSSIAILPRTVQKTADVSNTICGKNTNPPLHAYFYLLTTSIFNEFCRFSLTVYCTYRRLQIIDYLQQFAANTYCLYKYITHFFLTTLSFLSFTIFTIYCTEDCRCTFYRIYNTISDLFWYILFSAFCKAFIYFFRGTLTSSTASKMRVGFP